MQGRESLHFFEQNTEHIFDDLCTFQKNSAIICA